MYILYKKYTLLIDLFFDNAVWIPTNGSDNGLTKGPKGSQTKRIPEELKSNQKG